MRLKIAYLMLTERAVVVKYKADWCGPCKKTAPLLHRLDDLGYIKLIEVDTDRVLDEELEHKYGAYVPYIPTITVYRRVDKGYPTLRYHGSFPTTRDEFIDVIFGGSLITEEQINEAMGEGYVY